METVLQTQYFTYVGKISCLKYRNKIWHMGRSIKIIH